MADQQRWFKLWCSAPGDESLQALPAADCWAWAALGCYTKLHGTNGTVTVSARNLVLAAEMRVAPETLMDVISRLPHVHVEEGKNRHGEFTVTWQNWVKYQVDSTQAERAKASRSKRRREEKREEEKRFPPKAPPSEGRFAVPDSKVAPATGSNDGGQGNEAEERRLYGRTLAAMERTGRQPLPPKLKER